jgi:hypothetical protein
VAAATIHKDFRSIARDQTPFRTDVERDRALSNSKEWNMAQFEGRDLHLVKKALAIAVLAIERQPGPFQSAADQADMKALLDRLIVNDVELEHYARAARIAVTGEPD